MYSGLASSIDVALRSSFVLRPSSFVRQSYQTTTTERMDVNFAAASCDREDFLLLASLPLPSLFLSLALSLSLSSVLPSLFLQPLSTATVRSLPTVIVRLMKANCALSCQRIRAMRARLSGCERCVLSCQRMRAVHTVVSTDASLDSIISKVRSNCASERTKA